MNEYADFKEDLFELDRSTYEQAKEFNAFLYEDPIEGEHEPHVIKGKAYNQ